MKKLLLLASISMTVSACLAGQNSSQQATAYSNIATYVQEKSVPISRIPAYEVTVADLVNTPWDASSPKKQLSWYSVGDYNGAQLLEPLSITLEKGQDLLIHVGNTNGLWNRGLTIQTGDGLETDEVEIALRTLNYGGWGNWRNWLLSATQLPLDCLNNVLHYMKKEQYITYHFKNNYAGETRLEMAYCIDDHGVMNNNRCNENGKKINVKKLFITTK
ncbi:MAG: hypothetical protein K2W99_04775 [Chthoniobacterales bacterium]|nr:hypothetical protein [Chthoniobacterales bacterium]